MLSTRKRYLWLVIKVLAALFTLLLIMNQSGFQSEGGDKLVDSQKSSNKSSCGFVVGIKFKHTAGLGNWLWQHISLLAIAYYTHRIAIIPTSLERIPYATSLQYFSFPTANQNEPEKIHKALTEKASATFTRSLLTIPCKEPSHTVQIRHYLQSARYLNDIRELIKENIVVKPHVLAKSQAVLDLELFKNGVHRRNQVRLVGIHARRGNVVHHPYGHVPANKEYILRAIDYMVNLRPSESLHFLGVSDDLNWLRTVTKHLPNITILSTRHHPIIDHCMLTLCDDLIISTGSFAWTAAFFLRTDRPTIVYQKFNCNPGSMFCKDFGPKPEEYFFPDWIPL